MRQFIMTVMALAALGAMEATAQAENQTPSPPTVSHAVKKRAVPQNGRDAAKPSPADLGWDFAHPGRPGDHVSAALQSASTCTGLKSVCVSDCVATYRGPSIYFEIVRTRLLPYCEKVCNFQLEQCMKTGFWEGFLIHRSAERR
jgi:hypothetical protein